MLVALADLLDCTRYADQAWRRDALCRGTDVGWWHPAKDERTTVQRRMCAACPVRTECLQFALDNREKIGI